MPDPDPTPATMIAWRIVHVAAVTYRYRDYAFGTATVSFDLEIPGDAKAAVARLQASQEPLSAVLSVLDESNREAPRRANWGELSPSHRILGTLITEQVHHGAEIGLLRDLYRHRGWLREGLTAEGRARVAMARTIVCFVCRHSRSRLRAPREGPRFPTWCAVSSRQHLLTTAALSAYA